MPPKRSAEELHALSHPRSKRSYKETNWAVKKFDAEPLLRYDIQWQVLDHIFADRSFRFTAPVDMKSAPAPPIYVNFDQLFLEAILSSMKTTQSVRTKLIANPEFAMNYCKICLLINTGRFNTTLAFYPNMRTALRTYHPVPSLQTEDISRKEMSDAPRLKAMLKAAILDWEVKNPPTTLKDVARRSVSPDLTRGPPTTVIEAIFLIFQEASWVSEKYFPEGFDLWDIFFPSDMPAQPRARAFLSLLHHILENKDFISDFDTAPSEKRMLDPPIRLDRDPAPGMPKENVDPPEELEFARQMKELRDGVVKTVPAIQKKEEEARERLRKETEREQAVRTGEPANPAKRSATAGSRLRQMSTARTLHKQEMLGVVREILPPDWETADWTSTEPKGSGLSVAWTQVKRDLLHNRDPDYDSDEEEPWALNTLQRRATLTMVNPATGVRGPAKNMAEFQEWQRRRANGLDEIQVQEDDPVDYGGGGDGVSEMGDDD
ncbi:hypothetical protein BMF94_2913 [Rhodotorula taiwanensis]|uniref:Ino eighty subunit 1 n=1 Tax=Rhodotorula taiwanensis TaxID=741276 RepID=A0A2S5BBJ8_9BASI|nr:hypothetical protein BMF94_2913 [Rhodotorula taiwanensis]